jgi:beta-carotene 3-hydroxylase
MLRFAIIALVAFVAMEFVSYLAHRYVYHGFMWFLHKSHHTPREGLFEWNDLFPVFFASVTIVLMFVGLSSPTGIDLVALSVGITLYGAVYVFIHDLYVHGRMKSLRLKNSYLLRVKKAHMVHHATGGEPYGLLLFSFPRRVLVDRTTRRREDSSV